LSCDYFVNVTGAGVGVGIGDEIDAETIFFFSYWLAIILD